MKQIKLGGQDKIKLIYYICGRLTKNELNENITAYIDNNNALSSLRLKVLENLKRSEYYASKGHLNLIINPLEEIEKQLQENDLYFPNIIKNNLIKIGLLNGIPREFASLTDAIDQRKEKDISKHWRLFGNYCMMLKTYFPEEGLTKGEKMVLDKWLNEYDRLKEIIANIKI
jgi:hypothetical protein